MDTTPFFTLLLTVLLPTFCVVSVFAYHTISERIESKDQEIQTLQYQISQYQQHIRTLTSFAPPFSPGIKMH